MIAIRYQFRVLRKLLWQSWLPALLALAYAGWEYLSLPDERRSLIELVRSWGVTFFLIMWFVGQWLRASKQISDSDRLRDIQDAIEKSLDLLREKTEAAVAESPNKERAKSVDVGADALPPEEPGLARILATMTSSPKAALMLLSADIEREVRRLLWSSGWIQGVGQAPMRRSIEHLMQMGVLTQSLGNSLQDFLEIRNRLVHGKEATEDEVLRGIDIGLTIFRAILAVPVELNHVYHPGIEVFEDPQCQTLRPGIKAVVLETTSPDRSKKTLRFFPTTRTDYHKGQRVTWERNPRLVVLQSWVRRPDNGIIEEAWTSSTAEFVGRNLDEV